MKSKTELNTIIKFLMETTRETDVTLIDLKTQAAAQTKPKEKKPHQRPTPAGKRPTKEAQVTCPHCGFMGWDSPNTSFNRAHAYMTEHHFDNCMIAK